MVQPAPVQPGRTRAQLREEFRAAWRSFPRFCGLLQVRDKTGKRVPFRLNRTQRAYLKSRTNRDIALKGRQVGLTTIILALMVYRFLTVRGAKVVIVCQAMKEDKNVKEIGSTIEVFLQSLERFSELGLELDFETRTTTSWALRGRDSTLDIITAGASEAAAEKKGRSQRITHLHCTEVAYWEHADATLRALFNCVPAGEFGSEIILECTANGATGAFFEHCELSRRGAAGSTPFNFHFFPWYSHEEYETRLEPGETVAPRTPHQKLLVEIHHITPEQLKWWQNKVGTERGNEDFVNQEFPSDPDTCFLVSGRGFFSAPRVAQLLARAKAPELVQNIRESGLVQMRDAKEEVPALRVWHQRQPGREYVVICDTSEGEDGSAGCAGVFERGTGRHMATLWGQIKPWTLAKLAVILCKRFGNAMLVVERNNHGHTVLRAAEAEQGYTNIFKDTDEKLGWLNHEVSRGPALDTFEHAVRDETFTTDDYYAIREMRTFIVNARGRAEHASGARDDLVLMMAIGWDVLCRVQTKREGNGLDEVIL